MGKDINLIFELGDEPLAEYMAGEIGKPFDALAPGTFTDMHGRKVTLDESDFSTIVGNTMAAIQSTETESGKIVGLPIDKLNHEKGDAAGWIVSAELVGNKIRLTPRWNPVGVELIRNEVVRRFSATLSLAKKVILGGSLVNWPALVTEEGISQLRPIELAQPGQDGDVAEQDFSTHEDNKMDDGTKNLISETVQAQVGDSIRAALQELKASDPQSAAPTASAGTPDAASNIMDFLEMHGATDAIVQEFKGALLRQYDAMRDRASQEAQAMLRSLRREQTITEFSTRVTTGSDKTPYGIPASIEDLKGWLMSLDNAQLDFAMKLLDSIQKNGLITFAEFGHDKTVQGTEELPLEVARALDAGALTVSDLSSDILELGDLSRYNLSRWSK
jgi:hypothetical protein